MDLQKHYESYIASLREDALEHYEQYAKDSPTKYPAQWPTIFDYISDLVPIIRGAIANGDSMRYLDALKKHQFAMVSLFSKMVMELIWDCRDAHAEDLLKELSAGWRGNWVKFHNENYKKGKPNIGETVKDWTQLFLGDQG